MKKTNLFVIGRKPDFTPPAFFTPRQSPAAAFQFATPKAFGAELLNFLRQLSLNHIAPGAPCFLATAGQKKQ